MKCLRRTLYTTLVDIHLYIYAYAAISLHSGQLQLVTAAQHIDANQTAHRCNSNVPAVQKCSLLTELHSKLTIVLKNHFVAACRAKHFIGVSSTGSVSL